ncbi:DUF4292 domain-containing protein [Cardinium endosymbiont of Philonthus spinipes]|uniref:DUF4292 domain-containing protein n=1 Tax=Cardinium endosymbiont of Philonthus spinipes TaxID=3077941 RepID=UPI00313B89B1
MKREPQRKGKHLYYFWVALYLLSGCGLQQDSRHSFDVTGLCTSFPACFSMQASLHFIGSHHVCRLRVRCCVTYDQQIAFLVKGPFGVELMRGVIDKKGVTVVDRLRRLVYQWDYKRIREQYHFPCHYALIQSLLLAKVCSPMEDDLSISDALPAHLSYTYDDLTRKVIALQLSGTKSGDFLRCLYQYKMVENSPCLSGSKIVFSIKEKGRLYRGRATLHKLHFKKLKKPNIQLTIPPYYRK